MGLNVCCLFLHSPLATSLGIESGEGIIWSGYACALECVGLKTLTNNPRNFTVAILLSRKLSTISDNQVEVLICLKNFGECAFN